MLVILAHLEDEVSQGCAKMEDFENFVLEEVFVGTPLTLSTLQKHENMRKFEAWKTKRREE